MSELEKEQPAPEEKNATSRRDFIKLAGALAGAAGVTKLFMGTATAARASSGGEDGTGHKWGMLIDINLSLIHIYPFITFHHYRLHYYP